MNLRRTCATVLPITLLVAWVSTVSAAPHEHEQDLVNMLEREERFERDSDSNFDIYKQIALASGGNVYNTDKTNVSRVASIIGGALHHLVLLDTFSMRMGESNVHIINVDNTIQSIKVQIMETTKSLEPFVTVYNSDGNPVLVKTNYLGNGALEFIVQVKSFGAWWLKKHDPYNWNVSVHGDSLVDFTNSFLGTQGSTGYSLQLEGRPIDGKSTPVIIQMTGAEKMASVDSVGFYDVTGTSLARSPLLPQGHRGDAFRAQINIPTVPFRVAVEGKDTSNNKFTRVKKSVIYPSPFELTIEELKGELHVHGRMYVYVKATNLGKVYHEVKLTASDDKGLVLLPTERLVYLWPGVSVTTHFEISGGNTSGVSSKVMIKATPTKGDTSVYQYVMRTFTVQVAQIDTQVFG